jgi:hypothetical protein
MTCGPSVDYGRRRAGHLIKTTGAPARAGALIVDMVPISSAAAACQDGFGHCRAAARLLAACDVLRHTNDAVYSWAPTVVSVMMNLSVPELVI